MDFRYRELSWKDICLDWDDFVFSLGKGYKMEGEILTMFSALEREVTQLCKPRWGYRVFSLDASDKSRIILMDAGYRQDALSLLIWRMRSYVPCLWLQPVRNLNDFNRLSRNRGRLLRSSCWMH